MTREGVPSTLGGGLLAEISEWKMEAKFEDNQRYFYHLNEVDLIERGLRRFVTGRKGTGKTAISEYLVTSDRPKRFAQKLTFQSFPFNILYELSESRFSPPNRYILIWKYLIRSSVAQMMSRNENIDARARRMLTEFFPEDEIKTLQRAIPFWTNKKRSLAFKKMGLELGFEQERKESELSWPDFSDLLQRFIEEYIDDSEYFVIFDELDEDYRGTAQDEEHKQYLSLLTGLIKAVQAVKSEFPSKEYSVFPVVFLRDDIYRLLRDPDRTKWRDFLVDLGWDPEKIKLLLAFRISRAIDPAGKILPFDIAWNTLFEPEKLAATFGRITDATYRRPRDYIVYLSQCARSALGEQGRTKITRGIVERVETDFADYLRSELEDEIQGLIPEIHQILNLISHIRKQTFFTEDFVRACNQAESRGMLTVSNPEKILSILFEFSVIGNQTGAESHRVFAYRNRGSHLNLNEPICIHRGLFKALQIV